MSDSSTSRYSAAQIEEIASSLDMIRRKPKDFYEHRMWIGKAMEALRECIPSSEIQLIKANPERLSSLEHSEVKPDGAAKKRSGEVDRESGCGEGIAPGPALFAGSAERGARPTGGEADREDLNVAGGAVSAPSETAASKQPFVNMRISYRGFSYGMGSEEGIRSLRRAIEEKGDQ